MDEEEKRLKVLHDLEILDTNFDNNFDRITELLQKILNTPIVLISLVDDERQWFKSYIGLNIRQTRKEISFCSNAIKDEDNELYIVEDATKHPIYMHNPLVINDPKIRFYAGCTISFKGYNLGTICAIDRKPRILNQTEKDILKICGDLVESELIAYNNLKKIENYKDSIENIASIISHDLVNTVSPIVSLTDYFIKYPDTFAPKYLKIFNECGKNAIRLSKDMGDLYDFDTNNIIIEKEEVNICDFMNKYYNFERVIDINITCNNNISIDTQKINKVINNLLSNSIDFIDDKTGWIKLCCKKEGKYIIISVEDNGIGIPKDKHDMLFKKFSKDINPHVKRKCKPSGLGLIIAKYLIELHGGKIWIDEQYTQGVKFLFSLPI